MEKKLTEEQKVRKIVVSGLREAISVHGPITKLLIGSAAKRIAGAILARRKKNERSTTDRR